MRARTGFSYPRAREARSVRAFDGYFPLAVSTLSVHPGAMWFSRRPRPDDDVRERVEVLERRLKSIEADWDEWYDKFRRLYMRLSKRVEREEKEPDSASTSPAEARSGLGNRPLRPLAARLLAGTPGATNGLLPDR